MKDPEPESQFTAAAPSGIMDLAKRIAGRAAETARSTSQGVLPDRTPGIRWLRKHKASDPRQLRGCSCRGCTCGRTALDVCRPCSAGRHAASLLGKAARRARAGSGRSIARVDPHRRSPAQRRKPRRRGQLDSVRGQNG